MENKDYFKYWGKASKDDNSYHLLPYHCLDVAAVGHQLLNQHPFILNKLSKMISPLNLIFSLPGLYVLS